MNKTKEEVKWFPTQGGTFLGYEPQWRHKKLYKRMNLELAPHIKGGDDWTKVPFIVIRGAVHVQLPNGTQVPLGTPFPRALPGVLETINLLGYEQANAIAWDFAATAASIGASIEVRVVDYEIRYDIKARALDPQTVQERVAAEG